jgi:hypothetical protein
VKPFYSFLTLALAALAALTAPLAAQDVAPTIATPPLDLTIMEGDYIYFEVAANGTEPLSYQWRKNGSSISGGTDYYYLKDPSVSTDAGDYTVVVTNSTGSVTSVVAKLTILIPPAITTQPVSKTVIAGTNVTFTVKATGSPPLEYQWFFGNAPIDGATATNLLLVNVQLDDAGIYTVAVSNPARDYGASDAVSDPATLTVTARPTITDQPDDVEVTAGADVAFSVQAEGTDTETCPLVYQWFRAGHLISGETDTVLQLFEVVASDAVDYFVTVENCAGKVYSRTNHLTVNTPPVFTLQPVSRTVYPGSNTVFRATATGTPAISYQWYYNNSQIGGATGTSYSFFITGTSQRGTYSVVASNVVDEFVWSDDAYLTVRAETVDPVVSITSPANGALLSNAVMTVVGTASDNAEVDYVFWSYEKYKDDFRAVGTTNWVATVPLTNGVNDFNCTAVDTSGNTSLTGIRSVFRVVPAPMTLGINGGGTVAPYTSGAMLIIQSNYVMTATANAGWAFTNWTGGYTTNHPTIKFMMKANLTLTANFRDVQNPTVTVTNPLPSGSVGSALAVVSGSAADNGQVASVRYQFNTNAWALAAGTTNWTTTVTLVSGTNTFKIYSTDAAGNVSLTNTMTGTVTLVTNRPVVTSIQRSGTTANVSFTTTGGLIYNLEFKNAVTDAAWNTLSLSVTGTGGILMLSDTNAPAASRYYRVRAQ